MKRFLPLIVLVVCSVMLYGQAPKGINYQGVARDGVGNPIASKTISVRISVLKNEATGVVEFSETHKPQTNQFGLFTLVIGKGTIVNGSFTAITWALGDKWLQIEIDTNGGNSYTLAGTQQLMSVPYALYAETAGSSSSLTAGQGIAIANGIVSNTGDEDNSITNEIQTLTNTVAPDGNNLSISGANSVTLKNTLSQVLTAGADAGGKVIQNLGAPVNNNDAASKNYVDAKFAADLDIDPTNELQNLAQVLTRGNDAGGQKITNVGAPTAATDAATKNYVDAQNALDTDASATNEIQDLTLNTGTNILKITNNTAASNIDLTPYKQTLTYTAATNNLAISGGNSVTINTTLAQTIANSGASGADGNRIQNVGAPVSNNDVTTKSYVDNAIATNYAFKVPYSFTNSGAAAVNQVVPFGADVYDDFSVVATNRFTAAANGTYMFFVDGTLNNAVINLELRVNGATIHPIRKQDVIIGASVFINTTLNSMIKLNAGDFVEVIITSFVPGDNATGHLFGYKL